MDLKIVKIVDHGTLSSERVIMKAVSNIDLYYYAICDNTYKSGTQELSNSRRNFFWFPDKEVKSGEYVRLWTKIGEYKKITSKDKDIFHDFYWGLNSGVWNDDGDLAVLFQIEQMELHQVKKIKK